MPRTHETTVDRLVTEHPAAMAILDRYRIDYCCAGGVPLSEACARAGVDPSVVLAEVDAAERAAATRAKSWDEVPLDDVIDYILQAHHRPLSPELRRLHGLARRAAFAHRERAPELGEVLSIFLELEFALESHMAKEEQRVFPHVREGRYADSVEAIEVMEREHDDADAALKRLRALTGGFAPPGDADETWRALYDGLAKLEAMLHEHMHLENNVMVPRAKGR